MKNDTLNGEQHRLTRLATDFPFPLALVVREYVDEKNTFVKLHRMTDTAELLTRFLAGVLFSDLLRQLNLFPKALCKALTEKIERPTFGAWKELLVVAVEALPKRNGRSECFIEELPKYVKEHLLPSLGVGEGDPTKELISLRNLLAHLGRLSDTQAQDLLSSHETRFERLLTELLFLANYTLLAYDADGRTILLRGHEQFCSTSLTLDQTGSDPLAKAHHVVLFRNGEQLDLFPLQIFSEIQQEREGEIEVYF